ncbi:MAG: DUF2330 domain-containing protein, partial [Polyangiales bacterium]
MRWISLVSAAAAGVIFVSARASAFCGFYVAPNDKPLVNDASMVALVRDGTRVVMSMSNNYKGPTSDFAMVVPVPVVVQKDDVKTIERSVFDRLEKVTAPRLVEYWEQDPCPAPGPPWGGGGLAGIGGFGKGGGTGAGAAAKTDADYGVKVEAKFAVGEYEIVVLGAKESDGLENWLVDHHYKIPSGASAALAPYVKEQQKFFVAKVDATKVKKDAQGTVVLSPLRVSYESQDFRLPVRLGLLNAPKTGAKSDSSPKQDLIVFVLSPGKRYDVANYKNVFVPTNLDVADATRNSFHSFYAALFDRTLDQIGGKGIVTEYSWSAGSCDPCPAPPLDGSDLYTLGYDLLPGQLTSAGSSAIASKATVTGAVKDADIVLARNRWRFKACYNKMLNQDPSASGKTSIVAALEVDGSVKTVTAAGSAPAPLTACIQAGVRSMKFEGTGTVKFDVVFGGSGQKVLSSYATAETVITRLHARYDAKTLDEDLVFRAAPPVVGGREWNTGNGLESTAIASSTNNFQARYVIRHPWAGKIACKDPVRGVWGGPPGGGEPKTSPALGLAAAPRVGIELGKLVKSGLDKSLVTVDPSPVLATVASVAPSAAPSTAPSALVAPSASASEAP